MNLLESMAAAANGGASPSRAKTMRVGVVSTYPPRACGIGTFSRDLRQALLSADGVSAVDLVRGLGALTGIPAVTVPGITGWYDTNYEGKRDACLQSLADGADLFLIHVEATDEAGHAGDAVEKVRALDNWDARILGPLVVSLDRDFRPWRLLFLPDHPTPIRLKTHTSDPVPYLLVDSETRGPGGVYTERATAAMKAVPGHSLMARLVG